MSTGMQPARITSVNLRVFFVVVSEHEAVGRVREPANVLVLCFVRDARHDSERRLQADGRIKAAFATVRAAPAWPLGVLEVRSDGLVIVGSEERDVRVAAEARPHPVAHHTHRRIDVRLADASDVREEASLRHPCADAWMASGRQGSLETTWGETISKW